MREMHLFAGAGGGILAGLILGHRPVCAVEILPYPREVLRARQADGCLPQFPIFDDVTKFDGHAFVDSLAKESYSAGMAGKPKKLSNEQVSDAVLLYQSGLSCADLALAYGVSRQAMWERIKGRTQMRPQARHGQENHFYRGGPLADEWVHDVTEKAIAAGVLVPKPCEVCGAVGTMSDGRNLVQAHHDDYNKPLSVRWLCQPHHHEWHKNNKPVRRTEAPGVDVIAGGFP
jgi:hypothetical protein